MSAQAFNDANDIEYEALQNELLVDGWHASEPITGLIQAVWAYAPERAESGPRAAPGSRVPWRGSRSAYLLDLTNDVARWLDEAEDQLFGPVRRAEPRALALAILRLGVLIGKVDDGLRGEVVETLRWYIRRARLLLQEDAPDRVIRDYACPVCSDEGRRHVIKASINPDVQFKVWCTGCGATWDADNFEWLGLIQESA